MKRTDDVTLYLVRHGQSEANLDKAINVRVADHAIKLSPEGENQASAAGRALNRMFENIEPTEIVRFYHSPYLRAVQTAELALSNICCDRINGGQGIALEESIFLRELEFGLFDGVEDHELPNRFPVEHALYEKQKSFGGEFYARMPLGESRCDVATRVHHFFGTLQRDIERHGVRHVGIFSHGVTLRQLTMMWCKLRVSWVERQPNPPNCSILLIRGTTLGDYAFPGFPHAPRAPAQEKREDGHVD